MFDPKHLIFLHGLESSSQSSKAVLLRGFFPDTVTPDLTGSLDERMKQLYPILGNKNNWTIIGSSFGGLMGALFTCQHPDQVRKLILIAPALMLPEFSVNLPKPVDVPTVVIHGTQDDVVPLGEVKLLAEKVFTNMQHITMEDNHRMHFAAQQLDWQELVK